MNYAVHTVSPLLDSFIKCFWTLEDDGSGDPVKQKILPDGCMEMIIHYGDLYRQHLEDGSSFLQPRSFIFGQITRYIEIEPTGPSGMIAARFLPDGLGHFLSQPLSELDNKAVSLENIFGQKGIDLENAILAASHTNERIQVLEKFLASLLTESVAIDKITRTCVDVILRSQGQVAVSELANRMNTYRRNLERRFSSRIGISPKQLSRIIRLQSALKMLEQGQCGNLTSLAYENGYFDQAHFIRDFREFTDSSPRSFYAENLRLATLFATAG